MKISKRAAFETALQSAQQIKQKISDTILALNNSMQQMQAGIKQAQDVLKDIQQLDVQVRSLQQSQQKQLETMKQETQSANDGVSQMQHDNSGQAQQVKQPNQQGTSNLPKQVNIKNKTWAPRSPTWWQKAWKAITPEQKYQESTEPSQVAGVRGSSNNNDLFVLTAAKKHKFWAKNFDYALSPYSHMNKIKKITDEVLDVNKDK